MDDFSIILMIVLAAFSVVMNFVAQKAKRRQMTLEDFLVEEEEDASYEAPCVSVRKQEVAPKPKPAAPKPVETPAEPVSEEYGIHSVEEARRAIVWGEILQRKY